MSASQTDTFIGRQPIFDKNLNLVAYELLYRNSLENRALVTNQCVSTSEVIINLITNFGFDAITGQNLAFINLSRDFIIGEKPLPLPADKVVIEVLEDTVVDQAVIDGLTKLSAEGYSIALDDYIYSPEWEPLLPLVDYIKVEVSVLTNEEIKQHVKHLRKYNAKLLAEKVESEEQYDFLNDCGFDYFQGYFLAKPKVLTGKTIPPNKMSMLLLLADLSNNEIEIDKLVNAISNDLSLSYKILRYINSAHYALSRKIDSIREAITYVGLKKLRHWASLITMSTINSKSSELMQQAMIRGHMCEQIAEHCGESDTQVYFSAGMLSMLDALLEMPMEDILTSLPLSTELKSALLNYEGRAGDILKCAIAYEQADWDQTRHMNLSTLQLRDSFFNAIAFSNSSLLC